MRKRVLLLAVSCRTGGLCPGGIDLDNQSEWIRIVANGGTAVQGYEIDFAEPLDIIEFVGHYAPQGKQLENWVIDNSSCHRIGRVKQGVLDKVYNNYGYHGFWNNYKAYLTEDEFNDVTQPSESILKVSDVKIYRNEYNKAKIDFKWSGARFKITGISMTDPDFYDRIDDGDEIYFDDAYIVISIPKEVDDWVHPGTGERRAYKFVSKVFEI